MTTRCHQQHYDSLQSHNLEIAQFYEVLFSQNTYTMSGILQKKNGMFGRTFKSCISVSLYSYHLPL